METVPYLAVALLAGPESCRRLPDDQIVVLGRRYEIAIDRLDELWGHGWADAVRRYWDHCHHFWARDADDGIVVERELVNVRQRDDRNGRVDLRSELGALRKLPTIGPIVSELTSTQPNWDTLTAALEPLPSRLTRRQDRSTLAMLYRSLWWEDGLGGPPSPGEHIRRLTVITSHAPWRDRRSRRLTGLVVHSRELWPPPDRFRP